MSSDDKESKTESPTEKRINDSRDEGNVATSREVPVAVSLYVFAASMILAGSDIARHQAELLYSAVDSIAGNRDISGSGITDLTREVVFASALSLTPVLVVITAAGLLASLFQTEPRLIATRISPKFSRISPAEGFKRIFSRRNYFDFAKSILKVSIAVSFVYFNMKSTYIELVTMVLHDAQSVPAIAKQNIERFTISLCFAITAIATVDFVWQRWNWLIDLRMTKQEIKDELKQSEGDPIVKSRLRSIGRSRARNRMMKSVPTATFVIANPTHISIALRYDREKDAAPVVVAVGADLIAARIRELATQHSIPVIEQVELARSMYKVVKVDQLIPRQFYQALAIIIRELGGLRH